MYDPVLGRWHAPDPSQQFHSPYLAMADDPANNIDPDGRFAIAECGAYGISQSQAFNLATSNSTSYGAGTAGVSIGLGLGTLAYGVKELSKGGDLGNTNGSKQGMVSNAVMPNTDGGNNSSGSSNSNSSSNDNDSSSDSDGGDDDSDCDETEDDCDGVESDCDGDPVKPSKSTPPNLLPLDKKLPASSLLLPNFLDPAQSKVGGSNLGTGLSTFDLAAGVYSGYVYNHTTYTTTKGIEKNILKANGQIRSARAAGFARASNLVRGVAVVGSVLSTGYSTVQVYDQWDAGGIQNVNGWDATDAGVGMLGLGASTAVYLGLLSNPVGWGIGVGVLIYSGSRLAYDLYNTP